MSPSSYFNSPWPGEDGTPDRMQVPRSGADLALQPGERLRCVRRNVFMGTMTVLREPGEVYFLSHSALRARFLGRPTTSCVEKIDPLTLKTVAKSPRLPGGPMWPGGMAVHRNGDLYVVYGRYCHRLDADCGLKQSLELPVNRPYNSFVILDNGLIATKDFSEHHNSALLLIDPETMQLAAPPVECPEPSIARLSSLGNTVYVVGVRSIFRLDANDAAAAPCLDPGWRFNYIGDSKQTYGWDVVLDGRNAWFMDNGKHRYFNKMIGAGVSPTALNLIRVSMTDPADHAILPISGLPGGSITNPPLFDRDRSIIVAYDSANAFMKAWRFDPETRDLVPLWEKPRFGCASHMILFASSGELITNDYRRGREHIVVLDIETGEERGRAALGWLSQGVVFPSVGWNRDVYWNTPNTLARVFVDPA
jgi:hypothetical protein